MSQVPGKKAVLITGCSAGGIGDALAQSFHRRGLRVFATARNLSKVQHLKEMGLDVVELDVTDAGSRKSAVEHVRASTGGTLDILINNAGGVYSMPLLDSDLDSVRKLFELNVFAVLGTTQAFAPLLVKSKGTVVNISTLNQISDTLRQELDPFGVKVIVVITGAVKTNIHTNDTATQLPDTSLYSPIKEIIGGAVSGKQFEHLEVDVKVYAEKVVNNVLKSQPTPRHWAGGRVNMMWAFSTFLWATAWDLVYAPMFGLTELKKKVKQTKGD